MEGMTTVLKRPMSVRPVPRVQLLLLAVIYVFRIRLSPTERLRPCVHKGPWCRLRSGDATNAGVVAERSLSSVRPDQ
jgi:hypothetical protein